MGNVTINQNTPPRQSRSTSRPVIKRNWSDYIKYPLIALIVLIILVLGVFLYPQIFPVNREPCKTDVKSLGSNRVQDTVVVVVISPCVSKDTVGRVSNNTRSSQTIINPQSNAVNYSDIIKLINTLIQTQDVKEESNTPKGLLNEMRNSELKNISITDSLAFEMKSGNLSVKVTRIKNRVTISEGKPFDNMTNELYSEDSVKTSSLGFIEENQ